MNDGGSGTSALLALGGGLALAGYAYMSTKKSSSVWTLNPQFRDVVARWRKAIYTSGWDYRIDDTFRSFERQEELAAEGKSKTTRGFHNYGLALDFNVRLPDGMREGTASGWIYPNKIGAATNWRDGTITRAQAEKWAQGMRTLGEAAKRYGCVWGGDWSKSGVFGELGLGWDPFHIEWHPGMSLADVQVAYAKAGGLNFKVVA